MKPKPFSELNHLTVPCAMVRVAFQRSVYRPPHDARTQVLHARADQPKGTRALLHHPARGTRAEYAKRTARDHSSADLVVKPRKCCPQGDPRSGRGCRTGTARWTP